MMRTLTPILSIIIAVVLFMFFTEPMYGQIVHLQQETQKYVEATKQYESFSETLAGKVSIKENRSTYESERINKMIPREVDDTQLLVDLEAMAKGRNLLFGNVNISSGDSILGNSNVATLPQDKSDELATTDISFAIIGTYEQFKDFLRDLESSLQLLEVTNINLVATDEVFQQFSVSVRAYAFEKQ